jgi:hypothetical protein
MHIKNAITQLSTNWNITVSTRSYDALKSHRLSELFPKNRQKTGPGCRFMEVPELTDQEVTSALNWSTELKNAHGKTSQALRDLLKTPYFLKLFKKVVPSKEIRHIDTEEQLLKLYWDKRIQINTAKEVFLRKLTVLLANSENLSCRKSRILTLESAHVFEELVSDGIICETSYSSENLAYSHNILLEYAIFKYAIPDEAKQVIAHLKANGRQPFLFRSSYIYYYSALWTHERERFWAHYFELKKIAEPLFRLVHQTVLNFVVANNFNNTADLNPLKRITDREAYSAGLQKVTEAIRFIRPEKLLPKDIELLLFLSRDISPKTIWELGFLTNKAIAQYQTIPQKFRKVAQVSRNYLDYYLEALNNPELKNRIVGNGRYWSIRNYIQCYPAIKNPKPLIRKALAFLDQEDFEIDIFYYLADELPGIAKTDFIFAQHIYNTIYQHTETSRKETSLGGGVVMSLSSNRKQDFDSVYHRLEEGFGKLL